MPTPPLRSIAPSPGVDTLQALRRRYRRGLGLAILLGLILAPALLIASAWEITRDFARGAALRDTVNHSDEERSQMQTVFSLMQDAETGQRGYILTGQMTFLEPYQTAQKELPAQLAKLEAMERANPVVDRVDPKLTKHLRELIERRMNGLGQLIRQHDTQGAEAAIARISTGRGKQIMDELRVVVAQISAEENRALDRRIAEDRRTSSGTEAIIIAMFVGLTLLLVAIYSLVLRQSHARQTLLVRMQTTAARQSAILENAQDSIVIFDPDGAIETINRAAEAMFGQNRGALAGRDISVLLDLSEDARRFLGELSAGTGPKAGVIREFKARRGEGTFPVEASFGLITLPEGDRIVSAMRDISERRRIETMKSEFVSTVSHELRTPLTSIGGSLGLLLGGAAGELPESANRLLAIAHRNCQRLLRLINDILDIEKIESGQMNFEMASQDLSDLAKRSIDAVSGMAVEAQVLVSLQASPDLPAVLGDADRLIQVIVNLVSNAIKFSAHGGEVEVIVAAPQPGRLQLKVRDHGIGIPPAFHSRIFSKFAQADSSDTRQKGGTGLGLAISKEIAERHGGRLTFESALGSGATFILDLPDLATAMAAPGAADLQPAVAPQDA